MPNLLSSVPGILLGGKSLIALIPFYQKCITPTWEPNEKIEARAVFEREHQRQMLLHSGGEPEEGEES